MQDAANPPKAEAAKPAPAPAAPAAPKPAPPPPPAPKPVVIRPLAGKAKAKKRHWGVITSFLIMVLIPTLGTFYYLKDRAADQFASSVGFTIRSEDVASAADLLGGLGRSLGAGSSSPDADILYEFIRSQALVSKVDEKVDLRSMYARHYDDDPIFSFNSDGMIEDLTAYWQRMVRISYDSGSGLMDLRVLAFDPDEATLIAQTIFEESSQMINNLSAIAREDATRYAREDLDLAVERLKGARESLTAFRISSEIVDPTADVQGQVGLLNTLQAQLAEALIDFDLLSTSTRDGDPRLDQAQRRIDVIESRIRDERRKFGAGGGDADDESYAETIAEFERLTVDREFAEQAYAATLSAFDGARAEANRQSRYLAAYIEPTTAQQSEFPNRPLLIGLVALFGFLTWAMGTLIYYAMRDRR